MKTPSIKKTAIALLAFVFSIGSANAVITISADISTATNTSFDLLINGKLDYPTAPSGGKQILQFADLAGGTDSQAHNTSWINFNGTTTLTVLSGTLQDASSTDVTSSVTNAASDGSAIGHLFTLQVTGETDLSNFTFNNLLIQVTNVNVANLPQLDAIWGYGTPSTIGLGVYLDGVTAVPEPATYALIFGGLAFGFVMLRRRIKG